MSLNTKNWADKFEELYLKIEPLRAKSLRTLLEEQPVYEVANKPMGYQFGHLAELLALAHKHPKFSEGPIYFNQWLSDVKIQETVGDLTKERFAATKELAQWNEENFSGLKPLVLGETLDVSQIAEYNDGRLPDGLRIAPLGLVPKLDDRDKVCRVLRDVHRELLYSAVKSGRLKLQTPSDLSLAVIEAVKLSNDPTRMRSWRLDSTTLGEYFRELKGNWVFVEDSKPVFHPGMPPGPVFVWKVEPTGQTLPEERCKKSVEIQHGLDEVAVNGGELRTEETQKPNEEGAQSNGSERIAKQAHRTQEELILKKMKLVSVNPLKLPKYRRGKQNVKADIRSALRRKNPNDFGSDKVFDLAWDRLRRSGDIRDS
jgi:hypothetical protein